MTSHHPVEPIRSKRWVTLVALLVPACAFLGLLAFATAKHGGAPAPGDRVPDFRAPLLSGHGSLSLSELRGRPVLLNFWWSQCGPCKQEAPMLRRAADVYRGKVTFVGIDVRDTKGAALRFVHRYNLDYRQVRDEGLDIYRDYGLTGQPESFFIDQNGVLVQHIPGPLSRDVLYRLLDILVARNA
jgi:cytochrome c biogenesis protein CcmG/thiol:disulfide interchange protein DsbE